MKRLACLALIFIATTSCKKKVDTGFAFKISPDESYALNSPVFSCAQIAGIDGKTTDTPTIATYRVLLGKPVLTWSNPTKVLAIDQIVVVFQNGNLTGSKYVYQGVDLTEFKGILKGTGSFPSGWNQTGNYVKQASTDASGVVTPTVLTGNCEFRIGGVPITDTTPSIRVGGQIKIFGRAVGLDSANNITSEEPVYTEVPVYFKYIKF